MAPSRTPKKMSGTRRFMQAWLNNRKAGGSSSKSASGTEHLSTACDSTSPVSAIRGQSSSVRSTPSERSTRPFNDRYRASAPRNAGRIGNHVDGYGQRTPDASRRLEFQDQRSNDQSSRKRLLSEDDSPLSRLSAKRSRKTRSIRRVVQESDSDDDRSERQDKSFVPSEVDLKEEIDVVEEDVHMSQMSNVDDDAGMQMTTQAGAGQTFDLSALSLGPRTTNEEGVIVKDEPVMLPSHLEKQAHRARQKLANLDVGECRRGPSEQDWYDIHPWAKDIRDKNMRRPGDEGYDKTTLYIPDSVFRKKKGGLTPFQQQYWKVKKDNYDVILFMKKGKFYEIFDIDADLCHKLLGLTWTRQGRGDMRFVGVPEIRFDKFASRLVELGYKVGRIEQTESAVGRGERKSGPSVCERSLVKILTKATVNEDGFLKSHEARYVLAIIESGYESTVDVSNPEHTVNVAVCYVDSASGNVTIHEFQDDFRRTETERLLTSIRPIEIIIDTDFLSERVNKLVRWTAKRTSAEIIDHMSNAFVSMSKNTVAEFLDPIEMKKPFDLVTTYLGERQLGSRAFNAMRNYLASLKIDAEILSLGNYTLLPVPKVEVVSPIIEDEKPTSSNSFSFSSQKNTMRMDAATLNCLELVANTVDSSVKGSLLSFINHASTPAGMRLLRKWVTSPLVRSEDINCRLDAVQTFVSLENELGSRDFNSFSYNLKSGVDLERALPRLHKQATVKDNAVMYNDVNAARVKTFFKVLRTIQGTLSVVSDLRSALSDIECHSNRLKWLVSDGGAIPSETEEKLNFFFSDAFDTSKSESDGIIIPLEGACPSYDEAKSNLADIKNEFDIVLKKWRRKVGDNSIQYFGRGTEQYQLEIPRYSLKKVNQHDLELVSQTKKVKRFYDPEIRDLIRQLNLGTEAFDTAKQNVMREIVQQFDQHFEIWSKVSKTSAELDALMGLARASLGDGTGPMCRPTVLPNDHPHPVFDAIALRHPVLASTSPSFVANDVKLGGGDKPSIAVLTGSNASGKSTISRSVGVVSILAQVGCFVPAESLTLRPFEDVFVRMGAHDDIARGLSTFMVEMEDVSHFLNDATSKSLVIADEVGRGTSTHDGYAIAYATLAHLAKSNKCMCLFSTHYHTLGRDVAAECDENEIRKVGVYEMASLQDEKRKTVTFLYKLQEGISKGSHGISCARLAGIPSSVCDAAEKSAEEFERSLTAKLNRNALKALVDAKDNDEALMRILDSL